jgi:hypothetical protein
MTLREMPENFRMLHKRKNREGQSVAKIGDELGMKKKHLPQQDQKKRFIFDQQFLIYLV